MISRSLALACSPVAAFSAFTNAEEVLTWWGDDASYRTTEWQSDAKPGGAWRARFASPDGQSFAASGTYTAVENPAVLNWTWVADWSPASVKRISMRFEAQDFGTSMTVTSDGDGDEQDQAQDGRGWDQILGWLGDYLSRPS